jgi:hypothetical protein
MEIHMESIIDLLDDDSIDDQGMNATKSPNRRVDN